MKQKRVKKRILILMGVFACTAVFLAGLIFAFGNEKQEAQTELTVEAAAEPAVFHSDYWVNNVELDTVNGITVLHSYIPWDSPRRPGEVREIRYLTIHETDNRNSGADSEAHNTLLLTNTEDVTGWHYTVDDHSVYHNIPDNEIGWNAGDNRTVHGGNVNGIGIEMCVNLTNDYEQTLRNTAALAGSLLVTYDLRVEDVRLHQDFMDKICPHRLITEGRVEEFYQMIRDAYRDALMEKVRAAVK